MYSFSIITGQTGTGKTRAAFEMANESTHESRRDIISADARQIYVGLDIVTGKDMENATWHSVAKVGEQTMGYYNFQNVRVWGCDIVEPNIHFSAHDFVQYVKWIMANAMNARVPPIVVGGTYLYIQSLLNGIDVGGGPDWKLREKLEVMTVPELQKTLIELSKDTFLVMNTSDAHNPRRLIRKIETAHQSKAEVAQNAKQTYTKPTVVSIDGYRFGSQEKLRSTIEQRVLARLKAGAVDETRRLLDRGYTIVDPGLSALGYPQLTAYIRNECNLEEATEAWIQAEVRYAKRQLSFMKRNTDIVWHVV